MMKYIVSLLFILYGSMISRCPVIAQEQDLIKDAKIAMRTAAKFMVEEVSTNGGYVDRYLADFSRRWGELEAYKTMIWLEGSGGTVSMGDLFLDAYEATGDAYYYEAAEKVAKALAWGQHESGGWNYFIDFAGDRSVRKWYQTIGKNAWGFEEHNHYYGNATFDGGNTVRAARFLLRIYLLKLDPAYKLIMDRAIDFVLKSQYPLGGWPQRYPIMNDFPHGELEDYTPFYTFNDDVTSENINFLIQCYVALGEERFIDPIRRGMQIYLITQQANPQAGWSKQHNLAFEPAHARTYEPAAIYPDFTFVNAKLLLRFYELTGDRKFLARVPDAISFLESVGQKDSDGKTVYPLFIELNTNKPLYPHRKGTGVRDGEYWLDYNPENIIQHYKGRYIDIDFLKIEYERLNALSPTEATKNSPLKKTNQHQSVDLEHGYLNHSSGINRKTSVAEAREIIRSLDEQGRWLVRHQQYTLPYTISEKGEEANTARRSDALGVAILDATDRQYISTRTFIGNMRLLIDFIKENT